MPVCLLLPSPLVIVACHWHFRSLLFSPRNESSLEIIPVLFILPLLVCAWIVSSYASVFRFCLPSGKISRKEIAGSKGKDLCSSAKFCFLGDLLSLCLYTATQGARAYQFHQQNIESCLWVSPSLSFHEQS